MQPRRSLGEVGEPRPANHGRPCAFIPKILLYHPTYTDIRDVWLDIDIVTPTENTTFGPNYGKTTPYTSDPYPSIGVLSNSKVVFTIDTAAFLKFYVDLLTRPVSVKFQHAIDQ
jgi:hypothetical protein